MPFRSWSFIRYCLAGGVGLVLNLVLTAAGHEIVGFGPTLSFGVALGITYVVNFLLARHLVFRAASGPLIRQVVMYGFTSLTFRLAEFLAFAALRQLTSLQYLAIAGLVLGSSFLVKFAVYRRGVFVAG